MMFEDEETLRMFIEESLEHLADIENDLLSMERTGANIDEDLVNSVFRAAHSIKGGAGFLGLTVIKELAHKIENVLGMIRNREMIPDIDNVNILLKAFDRLHELILDIENSNDADVAEHLVTLVGLATASLPGSEKESIVHMVDVCLADDTVVFRIPKFDIDQARKAGQIVYLVEYDLLADFQLKNRSPMDIMPALLNSGVIIETKIDIQTVGTLDSEHPPRIPLYMLYASIIEPDIMPSLFDVSEEKVHVIAEGLISQAEEAGEMPSEEPAGPVETAEPAESDAPDYEEGDAVTEFDPARSRETKETGGPGIGFKKIAPEDTVSGRDRTDGPDVSEADALFKTKTESQTSLRVNVGLLDALMTLAGELVLSRNQLVQGISTDNMRGIEIAAQRIDMVTSELQEAIMRTRMQSISNIFNKFPRVVRDLSLSLNKSVELFIEGKEVELDKTIIEAINDPLTHLVRNAVDHGIEDPETRRKMGKSASGLVKLRAYHEAGQVNIEISDDGKGLDGDAIASMAVSKGVITDQQAASMSEKEKIALIFLPGFSMARVVTDVSGRGVGMDVVKTNLDRLGGVVDIESRLGEGTTIKIKLPLTLAIIPCQIISVGKERYAIPQVNLNELLRIPASQVKNRIERVGDVEVVRLRGNLLPLLKLSDVLEIDPVYMDPVDGTLRPDRRKSIADRRSVRSPLFYTDDEKATLGRDRQNGFADETADFVRRGRSDRRINSSSAINIAVVSAGTFKYGLVVDRLHDSEEIVVKPLGRHLKKCNGYAGATIMGDGRVALILDVAGLAIMAKLTSLEGTDRVAQAAARAANIAEQSEKERASLLLFRNTEKEQFAVPLGLVERIERIRVEQIEHVGGQRVIQYREGSLPLYSLDQVANVKPLPDCRQLEIIIFKLSGREVGLMVTPPVDAVDVVLKIDSQTLKQPGITGSAIIDNHTTLMVDMFEVMHILNPDWSNAAVPEQNTPDGRRTVLFVEDSDFFRNQVKRYLEEAGYNVVAGEDGQVAWRLLQEKQGQVDLVLTDLEMPNMDGFELAKTIRSNEHFSHLPIIALTSLAGDEDIEKGERVGITEYQIKLDRDKLLASIGKYMDPE